MSQPHPPTKTTTTANTASIPLHVESAGKKIKVGIQLMPNDDENKNNNQTVDERSQSAEVNSTNTDDASPAAVSAGMLRALIQGRFGDDAQLCDQNGEVIADADII